MGGTPGALQQTRRAAFDAGHAKSFPHGTTPGDADDANAGVAEAAPSVFDSAGESPAWAFEQAATPMANDAARKHATIPFMGTSPTVPTSIGPNSPLSR
jgi:carbohydrate-binding DOMON domain-containing protein